MKPEQVGELMDWWQEISRSEAVSTIPKTIEYGSTDLLEMGQSFGGIADRELSDQEATEFGIYWYMLGKMARWTNAMKRGVPVSDDTLHDMAVYVKMAQRNRECGGWPGEICD